MRETVRRPTRWSVPIVALVVLTAVVAAGCASPAPAGPTAEPPPAAEIEPTVAARAPVIFLAGDQRIEVRQCTMLRWQAADAIQVYLDGRGEELAGETTICPTETTTYTLTVVLPDGTQTEHTQVVAVVVPTPLASATPGRAGAQAPVAPRAATPAPGTPTPTVAATAGVSVEFFPANHVAEIPKDDKCSAVVWRTTGVTDVQIEREGMGRKAVEAAGSEEVCFGERSVKFYLYFKLPDGHEERREVVIRRAEN